MKFKISHMLILGVMFCAVCVGGYFAVKETQKAARQSSATQQVSIRGKEAFTRPEKALIEGCIARVKSAKNIQNNVGIKAIFYSFQWFNKKSGARKETAKFSFFDPYTQKKDTSASFSLHYQLNNEGSEIHLRKVCLGNPFDRGVPYSSIESNSLFQPSENFELSTSSELDTSTVIPEEKATNYSKFTSVSIPGTFMQKEQGTTDQLHIAINNQNALFVGDNFPLEQDKNYTAGLYLEAGVIKKGTVAFPSNKNYEFAAFMIIENFL